MRIDPISNPYLVDYVRYIGFTKPGEPLSPVEKISKIDTKSQSVEKVSSENKLEYEINPELDQKSPVNKAFNTLTRHLDISKRIKAEFLKNEIDDSVSFVDNKTDEISTNKSGFILTLPDEQLESMKNNNEKNLLSNKQLKLKDFYSQNMAKNGVMVNMVL